MFLRLKQHWARWGEQVWYAILAVAGIWEMAGLFSQDIPTLSDLIQALVRRTGKTGRFITVMILVWLGFHFIDSDP